MADYFDDNDTRVDPHYPGDDESKDQQDEQQVEGAEPSKWMQLLVRVARGLAVPLASYYTGVTHEKPSGERSQPLDSRERELLAMALTQLVREVGSFAEPKTQAAKLDNQQPLQLTELVSLVKVAQRLTRDDEPEAPTEDEDPVAREIALRRELSQVRRDRLTQMAERTAVASWTPAPRAGSSPVIAVPSAPTVPQSFVLASSSGARITRPLQVRRSSASPSEAPMTSKTLSFSSRRSSHPNDDDVVWPAPMAGGPPPPVRTESDADIERSKITRSKITRSKITRSKITRALPTDAPVVEDREIVYVAPQGYSSPATVSRGCCGSNMHAPMSCAVPTGSPVVVTNPDGSCEPNPFKMSCETKLGLVNCLKRVICELLWCLEAELCVNGKFDLGAIEWKQILDCLSVALCSAIRCIPEVLCPTPQQPQLCATPCNDGFAVEESLP